MDIPDVDLVIVYGVPRNLSEMYQVIKHTLDVLHSIIECVSSYSYLDEQVGAVVYRELIYFTVNRKRKWL